LLDNAFDRLKVPLGSIHQQVYMLLNLLQAASARKHGHHKRHGPFRVVSRLLQSFEFLERERSGLSVFKQLPTPLPAQASALPVALPGLRARRRITLQVFLPDGGWTVRVLHEDIRRVPVSGRQKTKTIRTPGFKAGISPPGAVGAATNPWTRPSAA